MSGWGLYENDLCWVTLPVWQVEFSVEKSTFHLLVDGVRVTDGHLPNNEGSSLDLHNPVYLGGDPISKTTKVCITPQSHTLSLICLHNDPLFSSCPPSGTQCSHEQCYWVYTGFQNEWGRYRGTWGEPQNVTLLWWAHRDGDVLRWRSHHLRFDKFHRFWCIFSLYECKLQEMLTSSLKTNISLLDNYFTFGSQFLLAFELHPQYLTGLLFHVQSQKVGLNVFLMENKVNELWHQIRHQFKRKTALNDQSF